MFSMSWDTFYNASWFRPDSSTKPNPPGKEKRSKGLAPLPLSSVKVSKHAPSEMQWAPGTPGRWLRFGAQRNAWKTSGRLVAEAGPGRPATVEVHLFGRGNGYSTCTALAVKKGRR